MCGLLCIYLFGRLVDYNIGCKLQICIWHGVSLLDPNGRKGHANCVESIFVVHAFLNVFCSHCSLKRGYGLGTKNKVGNQCTNKRCWATITLFKCFFSSQRAY